jgi:hypothetical protein
MHMKKNSPWRRVVVEALTHRGFIAWTAVTHLSASYLNADGLRAEIRGGYRVRFIWPNGSAREHTLRTPTEIDRILDELLDKKS